MRLALLFCAVAVFALLSACSSRSRGGGMSDSTFVDVMYELIGSKNQPGADPSVFAAQRADVLSRHKVSLEDLQRKGDQLAENPEHAINVWGAVRRKLLPGGSPPGRQGRSGGG